MNIVKGSAGRWAGALLAVAAGLLIASPSRSQTIRYTYDDAGRLVQLTAPAGRLASYTYDYAGRHVRTERRLDPINGVAQALITHLRHDAADHIITTAHVLKRGETERVLAAQAIARLAGGTITRIETHRSGSYDAATGVFGDLPDLIQVFKYDGNARLVEEARTKSAATTVIKYEYDAVGNRLRKEMVSAAGAEVTHYTYNNVDRLVLESASLPSGGGRAITYAWDGNGNLASKTEPSRTTLYRYDPQNRLVDVRIGATQSAAQAATPAIRYAYDAHGNRVRKWASTETEYLIDSSRGLPQVTLEMSGEDSTNYVRGIELVWQTKYGGMQLEHLFPLPGHLGTSLGAVDGRGELIESIDHDAFGVLATGEVGRQAHHYTGEFWDQDAQLLYLRARWYDPRIGRFISADPFEGRQRDPRSLNRYSYAHGDPVHNADPTGAMSMSEVGSTLGIVGNLATRAMTVHGLYNAATGDGDLPVPPFLWGPVFAMEAAGAASEILSLASNFGSGPGTTQLLPPQRHHTIPEYMCGHNKQKLVSLPFDDHAMLHVQLDQFGDVLEKIGKRSAAKVMPSRQNQINKMTTRAFGTHPAGRAGIVTGLAGFYTLFDWWSVGIVDRRRNPRGAPTIEAAFWPEADRFIRGHTNCK
jgi:RHS repeat-associated protein